MERVKRWFLQWAEGDPPMDERVYRTIEDNFHVGLYVTGTFGDMRPKRRILSLAGVTLTMAIMLIYTWFFVMACWLQRDDFPSASVSASVALLNVLAILISFLLNAKRQEMIEFFRCMSDGFFEYSYNEEEGEIVSAISETRRQKAFLMTIIPIGLFLTGIVIISGRIMDVYAGVAPDTPYINGVYVMTPVPIWQPFEVTSKFLHYMVLLGESTFVLAIVGVYLGAVGYYVVSLQTFAMQLKILKIRIRKLHQFSYKLYRRRGGRKLGKTEIYAHHSYHQCYNECLNECVAHHVAIIKGFNHFQNSFGVLIDVAVACCAITVAMGLLLLVVGGKPSILTMGVMTVYVNIANVTIICWVSDQTLQLSKTLPADLYDTHWQQMDKRANKTMLLMLERCKRPLAVTSAVYHTTVTWDTYAKVMNSAYSYLNLLTAMQKN